MKNSYKIAYWSSLLLIIVFAGWIICFAGIAATSPIFRWTNLTDYLAFESANSQFLAYTAKFLMLLYGPLFLVFVSSFYDYAKEEDRFYLSLSRLFALGFAVLSSINYFVQLSAVRLNIIHGQTSGLENFVQSNPNSIMTAITMLGWTFFLGLSSAFLVPIFREKGVVKVLKYAFIINAVSCLLAGIGYVFQIDILTFFFVNIGEGGAMMTAAIAAFILFSRLRKNLL